MTRVAAIQMVSGPSLETNLEAAARLIAEAAGAGAKVAALPENFYLITSDEMAKVGLREDEDVGPIQRFLAEQARRHRIWVVGGTSPLSCDDPRRVRNACLVYDSEGRRVARYDKIHLFQFAAGSENYDESRSMQAGREPVALDTPIGRLALSVCYDIRFPELYRGLGRFDALVLPSAFTVPTGQAHWHVLLRARAIENLAYVIAPAQGGTHPGGRRTYGHSMIIDPWGTVLAERDEGEGIVVADIDPARLAEVRGMLPALDNRRL